MKTSEIFIFIVGNSRSGTTMLGWILGNHESIYTFHELHFFEELWSDANDNLIVNNQRIKKIYHELFFRQRVGYLRKLKKRNNYKQDIQNIIYESNGIVDSKMDVFRIFLSYETKLNGCSIPCEQTPRNVFYIKEILEHFPDAKIINMSRDPRDILLSQKKKWRVRYLGAKNIPHLEAFRSFINYHPITISRIWKSSITASGNFDQNKKLYNLKYESFVTDPEKHTQNICTFLEIEYNKSMLNIPTIGSSVQRTNINHLGINKDSINNWKSGGLNNTEIFICQKINSDLMKLHGYDIKTIHPNYLLLTYYYLSFPVKLLFSFIMNFKRMKNIRSSILRRLNK